MDVPLHPEIERVVRQKVESGEYPSIAALVEEALFLLVERDWSRCQAELLEKVPSAFGLDSEALTDPKSPDLSAKTE
jgi:Arc/MetJ-type ribon-helix-helix transcriptional regulator